MNKNLILLVDSYKCSHFLMLPDNTEAVYSYGEARKGSVYGKTVFYGLQGILKANLVGAVVTQEMLEEAKEVVKYHLGDESYLNVEGWQTIIDEFGGKLPLSIKSVLEGSVIPAGNVLFTIENTDDRFAWLTNYVESILMKFYYPTVVATRSKNLVDYIKKSFRNTSDLPEETAEFYLHDFGYRSCPSEDSAAIGGSAHLINSKGTDTVPALTYARDYYDADLQTLAFSVAALEHSIATARGPEGEKECIVDLMQKFPNGILSLVGDSYSIYGFLDYIEELKEEIISRYELGVKNGFPLTKVCVRPDSARFEGDTPEDQCVWIHDRLAEIFGYTINSKNMKVLHPAVSTIYGDGLTENDIFNIYYLLEAKGYSVESQVVGQGGGLLMKNIDRDVIRAAIKCSAQKRNGKWIDIQKNPLDKSKKSKSGKLKLIKQLLPEGGTTYETISESHPLFYDIKDELVEVFRDGELLIDQNFSDIRARAAETTF